MDILLSTNNTTLTFHTIEAVNINKERHHTCSIYMEWNTVFSPTYPTWALVGGLQGQPAKLYYAFKIYFRAILQFYRYNKYLLLQTDWEASVLVSAAGSTVLILIVANIVIRSVVCSLK